MNKRENKNKQKERTKASMQKERVNQGSSKKETFMQGVITLIFSQVLIKLLGLIYTLYLTNREGFGDKGNGIVAAGYQIYAMLLTISSIGVPNAISKLVSERIAVRRPQRRAQNL